MRKNPAAYLLYIPDDEMRQELNLSGTYFTDKSLSKFQPFLDLDEEDAAWKEFIELRDSIDRDEAKYKKMESYMVERYYVYLVYVSAFAKARQNVPITDIVQESCEGLIHALRTYNPTYVLDAERGKASFTSMAFHWITQKARYAAIHRSVKNPVYIPNNAINRIRRGDSFKKELHTVSEEYFKKCVGVSKKEYRILKAKTMCSSINEQIGADPQNPVEVVDTMSASEYGDYSDNSPFEDACNAEIRSDIMRIIRKKLKPREQQIVLARFGFITGTELTLDELGKKYGVTRERIRQIIVKSVYRLKNSPEFSKIARDYLIGA